ncbi:TRAP transporter small permease [Chloroflexota bacterium]
MKQLTKLGIIFDKLTDFLAFLAACVLIFTMLAVCTEIVMRYFLNRPLIWVNEVTEVLLIYITFLGAAWLLRREGHVKVDILVAHLGQRTQAFLGIISSIIGLSICIVLVLYGIEVSGDYMKRGLFEPTLLELPKGPLLTIIPIGFFLLFIQFIRRTYGYIRSWRTGII